jgi:RNA 3'-terminal phosphate cyclase (ATP)
MTASGPSEVTIEGGTHNPQAPPFDFLERVFLPIILRMGPQIAVQLERYGFYPAGGGCFRVRIEPCEKLAPIQLVDRGEITGKTASAIVANLPRNIAHWELNTVADMLNGDAQSMKIVETKNSVGPGNIVLVQVTSTVLTEMFCGFGKIGKSAESVASDACESARSYLASGAAAGEHLADQLLLPFGLAGGGSFTAEKLNLHARTNMDVISKFLPSEFVVAPDGEHVRVEVRARN